MGIIKGLLNGAYGLLPDSPFQALFQDKGPLGEMLGWVNWLIPFDLCFKVTEAWVIGIAAYYLFQIVRRVLFDLILKKLLG